MSELSDILTAGAVVGGIYLLAKGVPLSVGGQTIAQLGGSPSPATPSSGSGFVESITGVFHYPQEAQDNAPLASLPSPIAFPDQPEALVYSYPQNPFWAGLAYSIFPPLALANWRLQW